MARTQLFVGLRAGTQRQVFRAARPPKESELRNRFDAVIGPFVTRRGAFFCAQHGEGNPHVQHVSDAERISLRLRFNLPWDEDNDCSGRGRKTPKRLPEALEWIMKTILLIEDTTILRELFKLLLSKEFRVVAAATGQEAIEALRGQTFDLVLSDFHLPDMTGADVYYLQGAGRPAYVALSASDSEPEFQDWVQREGIPYLTKPCSSARLMNCVREHLSNFRACAEAVPA